MALPDRIPVFLLSGFLGSGKSTLLNELLANPIFHESAVIINEFGDVPIDHLLVREGQTSINQVSTGCLCCSGSTDLRSTLFDLHCAASGGLCPPFSRVIVETSGLGDPAPLVNALLGPDESPGSLRDKTIHDAFFLAGFVTLFDIVTGPYTIEHHFEALKQIAFADRIVLTKTDLAKDPATLADIAALPGELSALNASAQVVDRQDVDLPTLFSPRPYSVAECGEDVPGWLALEAAMAAEMQHSSGLDAHERPTRHAADIQTFSIICSRPVPEKRIHQFLSVLQNAAGQNLLRVKGVINIEEKPDRPLLVHAVQHIASDPAWLEAWPDNDHRTGLVFITCGIDPAPVRALFSAVVEGTSPSFAKLFGQLAGAFESYRSQLSAHLLSRFRRPV